MTVIKGELIWEWEGHSASGIDDSGEVRLRHRPLGWRIAAQAPVKSPRDCEPRHREDAVDQRPAAPAGDRC
jgi:hypothetical protein